MRVLFLDTNIFLQCQPLRDLPWHELSPKDDIMLVVPRSVQDELDKLKQDGNGRRAKRARLACTFLREIVLSGEMARVLRERDPKVQVCLRRRNPVTETASIPSDLDMSEADDRIIADLIAFRSADPDSAGELLTYDTGPMVTAHYLGLPCVPIPEGWLLPPETDERDKKILQLEKELSLYKKSAPEILISANDGSGSDIEEVLFPVTIYRDLKLDEIGSYLDMLRRRYPAASEFGDKESCKAALSMITIYRPPSKREIARYNDEEYPSWEEQTKSVLQSLPAYLESQAEQTTIFFAIGNQGSVPAENVIVEFEAVGGILLASRAEIEERESLTEVVLPDPPQPPQGTWTQSSVIYAAALQSQPIWPLPSHIPDRLYPAAPNPPRDRNRFHWKTEEPTKHVFECDEYRHQGQNEIFRLTLAASREGAAENGAIKCTVTARNMPRPVCRTIRVSVKRSYCDTSEAALALVRAKVTPPTTSNLPFKFQRKQKAAPSEANE